jgi:hypothetical protein
MKIDFKSPRYAIPIIALPFLFLFFHIYRTVSGEPDETRPQGDGQRLNETIADVSPEVKNSSLADKLDVYRNRYRHGDGYTAIGQLQEEQQNRFRFDDLYNEQEKRSLDSIAKALSAERLSGDTEARGQIPGPPVPVTDLPAEEKDIDPMELFRRQMALVDSMGKANDPDYLAQQQREAELEAAKREAESKPKLAVRKASGRNPAFNTIRPTGGDTPIQAIIDENITGYAGSRLRIRLLEDIMAGHHLIRQGTYAYAEISGFSGQRVKLSISSVMQEDKILPIHLEIYDNDGMPGLYVPASAFREFTRELGGNTTQGVTLQQQAGNNSQLVMSAVQRMFQSTTTAVSKQIRKNKAKIKYNTLVYLIDPQELQRQQATTGRATGSHPEQNDNP